MVSPIPRVTGGFVNQTTVTSVPGATVIQSVTTTVVPTLGTVGSPRPIQGHRHVVSVRAGESHLPRPGSLELNSGRRVNVTHVQGGHVIPGQRK